MVADELEGHLKSVGHEVANCPMGKTEVSVFGDGGIFLVVTSSHGEGDLPERARPFYAKLREQRPDLSGVRYGVFGLGDNRAHATTFCFGPKKIDTLLAELGATRIGELEKHDMWDKVYAEDHALNWITGWLRLFEV